MVSDTAFHSNLSYGTPEVSRCENFVKLVLQHAQHYSSISLPNALVDCHMILANLMSGL